MEFKKFNSVENSYRQKFLNKITEEGHGGLEYVVQEKIHGANFSFWMDGNVVKCGKRSGFVREGEGFYSHEIVKKKYYSQMQELFTHIQKNFGASTVTVYGELYGGAYPHKDVKQTNHTRVQKEVFYNPEQDFIGFDIAIDGQLTSVDFINENLRNFGIPYAKTLCRGNLKECLEFKNKYQTTIPALLGLPELVGNICEGNVIRPVEPVFLWSGERLILKNKNEVFAEKSGVKGAKVKTPKEVKQVSPEVQEAIGLANQYINENRLRNVLSKVGKVDKADFGKLMGLFTKDIIEDFIKEEDKLFKGLEKKEQKTVTKNIGQNAAKLIRINFLNIVDGEF